MNAEQEKIADGLWSRFRVGGVTHDEVVEHIDAILAANTPERRDYLCNTCHRGLSVNEKCPVCFPTPEPPSPGREEETTPKIQRTGTNAKETVAIVPTTNAGETVTNAERTESTGPPREAGSEGETYAIHRKLGAIKTIPNHAAGWMSRSEWMLFDHWPTKDDYAEATAQPEPEPCPDCGKVGEHGEWDLCPPSNREEATPAEGGYAFR